MQNIHILPYPEYIDLIKKIAENYEVFDEDLVKLIEQIHYDNNMDYTQNGPTTYTLIVDNDYPINWSDKTGKVFEIQGPNMRNKTNTLIYTATLLGLDWSSIEPYIEDKKIIRQADYVKYHLSHGIKAHLKVENNIYKLEIIIENSLAALSLWSKKNHENMLIVEGLSLESSSDWEEYRKKLDGLFDIQVVAKGRNFIAQVGFEEASNLSGFCKETFSTIANYMKWLNSEAPKKAPETIKSQIDQLNERLVNIRNNCNNIETDLVTNQATIDHYNNKMVDFEKLLNKIEIKKITELKLKLTGAKTLLNSIKEMENEVLTCEKNIRDTEESIEQNNRLLAELDEVVEELEKEFSLVKTDLRLPKDLVNTLEQSLVNKNIDQLLGIIPLFKVDPGTAKAHKSLGSYNPAEVSLNTKLLGVDIYGDRINTLNDLRKSMTEIGETAQILMGISEPINKFENLLKKLTITDPGDYEKTRSNITYFIEYTNEKKQLVKKLKGNIVDDQEKLNIITRVYGTVVDIEDEITQLSNEVDSEDLLKLDDLMIGIDDTNNDALLTLKTKIKALEVDLADLKEKKTNLIRQAQQIKLVDLVNKNNELANAIVKGKFLTRIQNLRNVQSVVGNINEYFNNLRLCYERRNLNIGSEYFQKQAELNKNNLGDWFDTVVDLVNQRIKTRCPFAFINVNGVKKAAIKKFDFLNEDFEVEGLSEGAKRHGGITSGMTVYGLATKKSGSSFGSVLLVDEWGDVGVYKTHIFEALSELPQLSFSIFVDVDEYASTVNFEIRR